MELFIVRIELHGKGHDEPAYQKLHELMQTAGFERTIVGNDKITYQLPPAEYTVFGSYDIDLVFDRAQTAANDVAVKNAVFVSQLKTAKWDGLIPV